MEFRLESSGGIELRRAQQRDKDFAYQVKKAAFKRYVDQVWGWEEDEQRKFHDRRFQPQYFHIISLGGRDVGVMSVAQGRDSVSVDQLYILPEYQGQGIGRQCMSMVIEQAARLALPVGLTVLKVNSRALGFYERLGFATIGDTDTHFQMQRWRDEKTGRV